MINKITKKVGFLIMILMIIFTNISFAETVSTDTDIQDAYDAYLVLETAYNGTDYTALYNAYWDFSNKTTVIDDDDTKSEEWQAIIENKVGLSNFFGITINSASMLQIVNGVEAFENDKNARTAYEFVMKYNENYEITTKLKTMYPTLDAIYTEALSYMPSENTMLVKDSIEEIKSALDYKVVEDTIFLYQNSKLLEKYNSLTTEEKEELALLINLEIETLDGHIRYWWGLFEDVSKVIVKFDDYNNNLTKETAENLIKAIDEFIEEDSTYIGILEGYFSVDSDYEYAKVYLQALEVIEEYNEIVKALNEQDKDTVKNIIENSKVDYDNLENLPEKVLGEIAYMMQLSKEDSIKELKLKWGEANKIVQGNTGESSGSNNQTVQPTNPTPAPQTTPNQAPVAAVNTEAQSNNPKTGDNVIIMFPILIVTVIGLVYTNKISKK